MCKETIPRPLSPQSQVQRLEIIYCVLWMRDYEAHTGVAEIAEDTPLDLLPGVP